MKFTQNIRIAFFAVVISATALVSCIKEETISNKEREKISLEAWIRLNKPELLDNYQENGGYYVEILAGDQNENKPVSSNGNDFGSEPLMEQDTCWFFCNITGRDINGRICMTRNGELADLCGTFSYFTHYVPYINYCGSTNFGLLEGTYLAMRNEFKLGNSVSSHGVFLSAIDSLLVVNWKGNIKSHFPKDFCVSESHFSRDFCVL